MGNVHMPIVKWSKVKIDADKDMKQSVLYNIKLIKLFDENANSEYSGYISLVPAYPYLEFKVRNTRIIMGWNVFRPYSDKNIDVGCRNARINNGYFAGNLGLGVIKEPGETLAVDVIYDDDYVEITSDLEERSYKNDDTEYSDWKMDNLQTVTENGIISGVKVQFDAYTTIPDDYAEPYVRLYVNGAEKMSWNLTGVHSYQTFSYEYTTSSLSESYELRVDTNSISEHQVYVKNRYILMRKRYIGIKAGQ